MLAYCDMTVERQRDAALLIADYFVAFATGDRRRAYIDLRRNLGAQDYDNAERSADVFAVLDLLRPSVLDDADWRALDEIMDAYNVD